MKTQHTPGPWMQAINSNTGTDQIEICGRGGNLSIASGFGCGPEADANAALMASAPELLTALKACVERMAELQEHTNYPLAWPRVMAADAIAKAEGKV